MAMMFFHIKVEDMGDMCLIVIFRQNIYLQLVFSEI